MILLTYFLEKRKILFGDSTKFPSRSFFERHAKMHVEPAPLERQEVQRQVKIPDEWKSPPPTLSTDTLTTWFMWMGGALFVGLILFAIVRG